jgi:hypothetical protein
MSQAELTAAPSPKVLRSLGLFRSELGTTFRRWRTLAPCPSWSGPL